MKSSREKEAMCDYNKSRVEEKNRRCMKERWRMEYRSEGKRETHSILHFESNEEEFSAERSKVANKQIRCMFMEKLMYTVERRKVNSTRRTLFN